MDTNNRDGQTFRLNRLAVGAARPMFSVWAWATHLGSAPEAVEFVAQLIREWLDAVPPNPFCAHIAERCRVHIAAWHSGWPNLWAHTLRVTGYTLHIASEAGVDLNVAYTLGMLHDVGKLDELRTGEPHPQIGARLARAWLADGFDPATVESIAAAIGKEGSARDRTARLLFDADKLDKIGASGLVRRMSLTTDVAGARKAVARVAADLRAFPTLNYPAAETLAHLKREFTSAFLAEMESEASFL